MKGTLGIVGGSDRVLEEMVRTIGLRCALFSADQLISPTRAAGPMADVVLLDLREDPRLISVVAAIKRRYPSMPIAVVVKALTPELMLEAMRSGVTEAIAEPLTQAAVEAAVGRVLSQRLEPTENRVYAIIGAKGGTGATTIAVNLGEALARDSGSALVIDLQLGAGDAAILLGAEPRFTVADALENTGRLDEAFFRGLVIHTKSGLDLLAASSRVISGAVDPHRIRTLIDFAARYYRYVVLDVPRGDLSVLDSLAAASSVFVVVNHELPTIRSGQRLVAKLRQMYGERVGVIVNRSDRQAEISLEDVRKAVNAPIRHVFPSDYRQALAASNKGEPLAQSTQGALAASFHELVRKLKGEESESTQTDSGRLFGWLSPRRST